MIDEFHHHSWQAVPAWLAKGLQRQMGDSTGLHHHATAKPRCTPSLPITARNSVPKHCARVAAALTSRWCFQYLMQVANEDEGQVE